MSAILTGFFSVSLPISLQISHALDSGMSLKCSKPFSFMMLSWANVCTLACSVIANRSASKREASMYLRILRAIVKPFSPRIRALVTSFLTNFRNFSCLFQIRSDHLAPSKFALTAVFIYFSSVFPRGTV
nr:hypothetical protein gp129 - Streptococcus phage phi-Sfi11 [Brussowvirus Sfi11]